MNSLEKAMIAESKNQRKAKQPGNKK